MDTNSNIMKIKAIMQYYGLNQTKMAAALGIPQTNLSAMLTGKRACGDGIIAKVQLNFPEINTQWLLSNDTEMIKRNSSAAVSQTNINGNNNYVIGSNATRLTVPAAQCSAVELTDEGVEVECPKCGEEIQITDALPAVYHILPPEVLRAPDVCVSDWLSKNRGECEKIDLRQLLGKIDHAQPMLNRAMEPRIPEGSILFLRRINEWDEVMLDGSIYGIDVARPHMIVRKVYDEGEFVRCEPMNPEYGAIRVAKSKVMDLYKIKAVIKVME